MSRRTLLTYLTAAILAGTTGSAWAQFQGGQGGTGFGGTTGGTGFGNSTFGGSNSFGGGLGSSGLQSGGTGFGSGTTGFGTGGSGFGTSALGNQAFGQSGLGTAQGGQAFVGRDSGDMQALFNQLGRSSNQFFRQLNRTMGRGQNRNRQTGGQENAALQVRVQLNVAFDHVQPQPAAIAATVRGRLERALEGRNFGAPEVEVDGDTVILRGTARSESQRLVIEKLVSLEPGVAAVDNRLTIADETPSDSNQPATNN